jgi:predicted amidohydrolase YtcJ
MRPRIEHAQIVSPHDLPRFARLGVIASMQPTHATSDMPWAEARLGAGRLEGAYAWRSISESGGRLAFGSDAPVEPVSPFLGIEAAVTRADVKGNPAGGWQPAERVSLDAALRAFTQGAAYAAFEEEVKGTIAPGRLADFVILADDPRAVAPGALHAVRVLSTWVGGVAVFEAGK